MKSAFSLLRVGIAGTLLVLLAAVLGPWLAPYGPQDIDITRELMAPSLAGGLGTGVNGIDVWSWLLHGARVSLLVGFSVVAIGLTVGLGVGLVAGYFGGLFDMVVMRIIDVLLAFPGILLAIYIAAILPPSLGNVILALSVTGWVGYARLVRGQVLTIREREYVQAARALGAGPLWIIRKHLLPNILGPVLVHVSFGLGGAILGEAALSFLGLGVAPGTPSWGALLDEGAQYLLVAPHLAIAPGIAIAVAVLSFNCLGDGLRDHLDSRST
ncbi:MAG: peptide ABC transporter permease [Myxococcales bacterium]|nr:peptide ABC transporter permease [Myxococcales bacterium]